MTPAVFLDAIIRPGCDQLSNLMGRQMGTPEALVLLLAIAIQESALKHRRQISGPARGWWQFEGGLNQALGGILRHEETAGHAKAFCRDESIPFRRDTIHEAIAWHDPLALAFARLLLWTDPRPLPMIGDRAGAWETYLRSWRPGKPKAKVWPENYAAAAEALNGAIA